MDSTERIKVSDPDGDDLSYRSVSPLTPVVSPAGMSSACTSLGMHDNSLSFLPTVDEEPEKSERPQAGRSGTSPVGSSATHPGNSPASPEIASPKGPYDWSYWRQLPRSGLPVQAASDQYPATTGVLVARSSVDTEPKLADVVRVHGGEHGSGKRPTEASNPVTGDPAHTLRYPVSHGHHVDESEAGLGVTTTETGVPTTVRMRDRHLTAKGAKVTSIKTDQSVLPNIRYLMLVEKPDKSTTWWNWVEWDRETFPDDMTDEFREVLENHRARYPAARSVSIATHASPPRPHACAGMLATTND